MASNLEHPKERIGDRISGLPDAVLCRILSFIKTKQAVQTSVLSHRWNNIWACVPNLRLKEQQFKTHWVKSRQKYKSSYFEEFVDRLLFVRGEANIHSFVLSVDWVGINPSRIEAWISTAIRFNVVELDLFVGRPAHLEIPVELLTCSTLRSLKLWLPENVSVTNTMTPSSNCFSSLKFLHVTVSDPVSDLMQKVFSCFPVLEDLIIDGNLHNAIAYNLEISAPRLKRLQIKCVVERAKNSGAENFGNCGCQFFFSADVPNLEDVEIDYWCLASYSLKNANCLRKAKIDFHVDDIEAHYNPGLEDRICHLFTGICHAKYLTVSSTIVEALENKYHSLLPTFNNLNHLVLHLQTCADLESLATLLKISPNLEHLKILPNKEQLFEDVDDYCADYCVDKLEPGWEAAESLPGCLHLKTLCLKDINGCPNEVKVIRYLVNKVTILNRFDKDKGLKLQSPTTALWSTFSKFQRGSKTCQIEFRTII